MISKHYPQQKRQLDKTVPSACKSIVISRHTFPKKLAIEWNSKERRTKFLFMTQLKLLKFARPFLLLTEPTSRPNRHTNVVLDWPTMEQ